MGARNRREEPDVSDRSGGQQNTHGAPGEDEEADTASGGAPDEPDTTTDEKNRPVDNPSGG